MLLLCDMKKNKGINLFLSYHCSPEYMRPTLINFLPVSLSVAKRIVRLGCGCATLGLACSCEVCQDSSGNGNLTKERVQQHVMIPYLKIITL